MRIGLMIGPEKGRYGDKVARLVADAEAAEQAGFSSIWVPQVPNDFDALTAIALMGQRHVEHRARDGGDADPDASSGRDGAAGAVEPGGVRGSLHARASARPTIGSSTTCSASRTSGRPASSATTSRCLNAAFAGPGPVDVENDDYRVHNPLDVTNIVPTPILLAALAPVMLRVAGELASGTILWMADERAIGEHVAPAYHRAPRRRRGDRRRAIVAGCPSRVVPQRRGGRGARMGEPGPRSRPSIRRTTSGCSSTATPPTSATSSRRGTSRQSSIVSAASVMRVSPTWRSASCRSDPTVTRASSRDTEPWRCSPHSVPS